MLGIMLGVILVACLKGSLDTIDPVDPGWPKMNGEVALPCIGDIVDCPSIEDEAVPEALEGAWNKLGPACDIALAKRFGCAVFCTNGLCVATAELANAFANSGFETSFSFSEVSSSEDGTKREGSSDTSVQLSSSSNRPSFLQ